MTPFRLARIASLAAAARVAWLGAAGAQPLPPANIPGAPPPGVQAPRPPLGSSNNPACLRLESALAQIDAVANANPDTVRRYEDAITRQRYELDQTIMQGRRAGCDSGGSFFLFGSPKPPQCDQLNSQIGRMRGNLDRMTAELGQMRGGSDLNRDLQRRQLIASLAQNNCGPQYRTTSAQPPRQRGFFEGLFGGGWREESTVESGPLEMPMSSTYRTLCVRTCDGFYFPISYATVPGRFQDDERACKRLCPAAEVALYAHRHPGEEVAQAVSTSGQLYSEMPNAFKYRQEYNAACSCRTPGQSWADALGVERDFTVQQGDIVVTEESAKKLAQPRPALTQSKDKSGRPVKQAAPVAPAAEPTPPVAEPEQPPPATAPG
ncbi:MAG: DUF2865 domain-containing protein, partial [Xanthobacteraceae bacterium]|nr:DUF2865 domain-containing protein [Xanthobacteraceae bacterium]